MQKIVFIFVVALVFSCLFGGFGLYRAYRYQAVIAEDSSEQDLSKQRLVFLNAQIESINNQLDELQQYREESVLLNMDAYNVNTCDLVLKIVPEPQPEPNFLFSPLDEAESIAASYTLLCRNDILVKRIKEELQTDIEEQYIAELFSVMTTRRDSLIITSVHPDASVAKRVSEIIFKYISENREIAGREHAIQMVAENTRQGVSQKIIDAVSQCNQWVKQETDQRTAFKKEYDALKASNQVQGAGIVFLIKQSVKYDMAGFLFGAFAALLIVMARAFNRDRMVEWKDITRRYSYELLGVIEEKKPVYLLAPIIKRLEKKSDSMVADSSSIELLAAAVKTRAKEIHSGKNVLVLGTGCEATVKRISDGICQRVDDNITILTGKNIITDTDSIKMLEKADAVVLVESVGMSYMSAIDLQLEKIEGYKKPVIGFIVTNSPNDKGSI